MENAPQAAPTTYHLLTAHQDPYGEEKKIVSLSVNKTCWRIIWKQTQDREWGKGTCSQLKRPHHDKSPICLSVLPAVVQTDGTVYFTTL